MRTAIVFSSPTPLTNEFQNVWCKCPKSSELSSAKLVIAGSDWQIFVFDGLSEAYCKCSWNYENIADEIRHIVDQNPNHPIGVYLHGNESDLISLKEKTEEIAEECPLFYKYYGSVKGTFFKKFIIPFASEASDDLFNRLWKKLGFEEAKEQSYDPRFAPHKLSNLIRWTRVIIEDAQDESIDNLLALCKLQSELELMVKNYLPATLESLPFEEPTLHQIPAELEGVVVDLKNIGRDNLIAEEALALAGKCLETMESILTRLNNAHRQID